MNEANRMAYLDAMEIDCLVSRRDLPGAKPSRRVPLPVPQLPALSPTPHDPVQALREGIAAAPDTRSPAPGGTDSGRIQKVDAPAPATPLQTPPPQPADPDAELPIFSLAVSAVGGCLWLDQLPPGRGVSAEYGQLLEAICRALALPAAAAEVSLFSFPMADLPQLGRDLPAARDALQGFLTGRVEQLQARAVILLGQFEEPWFNRDCLGTAPIIETVSAWQMLRQPELKRVAWIDLKALRGHGG